MSRNCPSVKVFCAPAGTLTQSTIAMRCDTVAVVIECKVIKSMYKSEIKQSRQDGRFYFDTIAAGCVKSFMGIN